MQAASVGPLPHLRAVVVLSDPAEMPPPPLGLGGSLENVPVGVRERPAEADLAPSPPRAGGGGDGFDPFPQPSSPPHTHTHR